MAVTDGGFQETRQQSARERRLLVSRILLSDQDSDRARVVAAFAQHLGELSIRLRMKAGLKTYPLQPGAGVAGGIARKERLYETRIGQAVDKKVSGGGPTARLVFDVCK